MEHRPEITPRVLFVRLLAYFVLLFGAVSALALIAPESLRWLPLGGTDAIEAAGLDAHRESQTLGPGFEIADALVVEPATLAQAGSVLVFLAISLVLAMLVMLPITWTYTATQQTQYRRTFVRTLIVLPVCATTIVLLIQDSLALAFGLAALVTAVRFRVSLKDPMDGIYIFSAVCVGLAVGIGFIGVAAVMATVFCFANVVLWQADYNNG